jgi:hypothetical protein
MPLVREMGGDVFPPEPDDCSAYANALAEGENRLVCS